MIDGVYYRNLCFPCKLSLTKGQLPSSGHARWARSVDLEDNEVNIQQPWNADGTPNARFIKMYPKQAKAVLSEEDMRKAV